MGSCIELLTQYPKLSFPWVAQQPKSQQTFQVNFRSFWIIFFAVMISLFYVLAFFLFAFLSCC